jgi:exodeoxyribonuclease-3
MKIATFNVNDVKTRLDNLLGWLRRARPDVACLQELKTTDSEFPIAAIKKAVYLEFPDGLSRTVTPVSTL